MEFNFMYVSTVQTVLAGDIGGTKTRLAAVEVTGTQVRIVRESSYASRNFATFDLLLADFLFGDKPDGHARFSHPNLSPQAGEGANKRLREFQVTAAAFGVAGPVQGRVVQTTNLPWRIDADALQRQFGFAHCTLLNDLEATAYGLSALGPNDLLTLQAGVANSTGNAAVIAAGTGLGEAGLYWDGQQHQPFATEGGHASFSPGSELEMALLCHLQQQHQHVSWERVVSGMGLLSLHDFLRQYRKVTIPGWLAEEMRHGDAAAVISNAALAGRDEICVETLDCFVRLYGAEAGNLALKVMSRGGLYVGGGIAPKILPVLTSGVFLEAFLNKGRMRHLLEVMPVRVILNDRAALYGPAIRAAQLAVEKS
jgi:glucokinase